jgi:ribosomal protein S18 acetylase RimI-like enzyme
LISYRESVVSCYVSRLMEIRPIHAEEHAELGDITVRTYRHLAGGESLGGYEEVLVDVTSRTLDCEVFVAVDADGKLMGGVTYVPGPGTSMSEFSDPSAAGIRHLAVDPDFQGSGAGRALVEACINRAREQHRDRVRLHSTPPMVIARAMYERMGFVRTPEFDLFFYEEPYTPEEPLQLIAYALSLV